MVTTSKAKKTAKNTQSTGEAEYIPVVPPGTIIAYGGKAIPLGGWALCDGREVNINSEPQYKALFNAIGNTWGGAGNPNFKLPDLGNKFLRGVSTTSEVSLAGGSESHSHSGTTGNAGGDQYGVKNGGANPPAASGMAHQHSFFTSTSEHLPPFVKIVYLIKL